MMEIKTKIYFNCHDGNGEIEELCFTCAVRHIMSNPVNTAEISTYKSCFNDGYCSECKKPFNDELVL